MGLGKYAYGGERLVSSKDIFVTTNDSRSTQDSFKDLNTKKLALVNGYHYKFVNLETDAEKRSTHFDLTLVRTEEAALKMVLANRVEISVVSETALNWFLLRYPEKRAKLLIS